MALSRPVLSLEPNEWLRIGLDIVGFDAPRQRRNHSTNLVRFYAHFGARPEVVAASFVGLQTTRIAEARVSKPSARHYLMALMWLKLYPTEPVLAGALKVDEKTASTHVWKRVKALAALKGQKVRPCLHLMYYLS